MLLLAHCVLQSQEGSFQQPFIRALNGRAEALELPRLERVQLRVLVQGVLPLQVASFQLKPFLALAPLPLLVSPGEEARLLSLLQTRFHLFYL